jgi:nicotianamine synthase
MLDIFPAARVHNIDRDLSALSISQSLSERLGYADRMTFACTDVSTKPSELKTAWQKFDVVFLAALVGVDTASKLAILEGLVKKMRSGALIVARSAKGLRTVLYPVRILCAYNGI